MGQRSYHGVARLLINQLTLQQCSPFYLPIPSYFQLSQHHSIHRFVHFIGQCGYHGVVQLGAISHQPSSASAPLYNNIDPFGFVPNTAAAPLDSLRSGREPRYLVQRQR